MKRIFILSVLLGAFGTLQAQFVDFNVEIWKGVFAAGDIDNDGDLDVIVSGDKDADNLEVGAILINDGTGSFTAQDGERVITAGRGGNIHFGDIDGDGDLDVIFAGWGCTNDVKAGIALNDGSGNFTLADTSSYPVLKANTITSCGFADFDLNGLLDYYFFGNDPGNCVIYFQQADGSFTPVADAIKTTQRYGAAVGDPIPYKFVEPEVTVVDFNKDGYPDMWINAADINAENATVDGEEQTRRFSYLFKNDGFGNLLQFAGAVVPYKKGNGASSWGDINGDGFPDMLLHGDGYLNSGEDNDRMWRVFANLNGSSIEKRWEQEIARQGSFGNGSVIVDWDNDGKLDFFTGGWNETAKRQEIALFLGDDPSQFTFTRSPLSDTYIQGASEQGLLTADLNGDNKVELLLNGFCGAPLNKRAAGYMVNQSTAASVLPAAPTGLNVKVESSEGEVVVTFSWIAPESNNGVTYNLALKNTTTGKWLYNPMAVVGGEKNGWRKIGGRAGNVFTNTQFELYNLPEGAYEYTVQAINGAYLGGAFAEPKTFTIGEGGNDPDEGGNDPDEGGNDPDEGGNDPDEGGNDPTGVDGASSYAPKVYTFGKKLIVEGNDGSTQLLKVYSIGGTRLVSATFAGSTEVELPAGGIYIVELTKNNAAPFRKKVLVK
ncbi:MAG: FG-GAP-like repeat-containing protein [Prevotellaceae bacterium]|jgi:hypothetical protein|nr:FG-GAP-like repeat-containing protein [Prevotellaceae bacterium]